MRWGYSVVCLAATLAAVAQTTSSALVDLNGNAAPAPAGRAASNCEESLRGLQICLAATFERDAELPACCDTATDVVLYCGNGNPASARAAIVAKYGNTPVSAVAAADALQSCFGAWACGLE